MKRERGRLMYKKYKEDQIEKTDTEDNIFLFAKRMIRAKDEKGINLFWNKDEEDFLRKYIEFTEEMAEC